jgi:hypothetical protein
MSFLDCICCGFGAVILFYTVISAQAGVERIKKNDDLAAQVNKLDEQVLQGTKNLVVLRNTLDKTRSETVSASSRATRLIEDLQRKRIESAAYNETSLARRERIEKLKADIRALEESTRRLEASAAVATPRGELAGTPRTLADKRYITGLNLKGRRVLVLVDRSASMLDDDLVRIITLRNSPEAARRTARKWRRAVEITNWVTSQLPRGSSYQVYGFNTAARAILPTTAGKWLAASDAAQLDQLLRALDETTPLDGTSLINALRAVRELSPAPDQIVLITDGLPTQGASPPALSRYINVQARARLFDEAIKTAGRSTPIDVVLLPMKGDLLASHRFWTLARNTGGSFLMPSRDWP